jgi:hypothetical protein
MGVHTAVTSSYNLYIDMSSSTTHVTLNIMVEWLSLFIHIRELVGSNLDPETGYPE